ncbi:MAG TPA: hypothetical protein VFU16_07775 [Solirubrobacterales bacterium]|nr:hypothetical protein [Solirubrobacterales bacterium]
MSRIGRGLLSALVAAAAFAGADEPALAAGATPWQAMRHFTLEPSQVSEVPEGAARIVYRLLDPQGLPVGTPWEKSPHSPQGGVSVPPIPGVYTLEARFEDSAGSGLGESSVLLRFDDTTPPLPAPRAPGRWLMGTEQVSLGFDPPEGPLPPSGIAGYEVTLEVGRISRYSTGEPVQLSFLPEGVHYGQVVAISGAGVRSQPRTVAFAVDGTGPTVSLRAPAGWSAGPTKLTATAWDALSGMEAAGSGGPFTAISVDGGAPVVAAGATASDWVGGSGVHSVRFYGRDAAGNLSDGRPGSPPSTAVVRIDEEPPRVEFAAAQDPADPERIEALVDDHLSGPSADRGTIAVRASGTRARFEPLPTRVEPGRLVARWDSDSYPPGKYEFLATGFDVAGNPGTGTGRAHGGRMVLVNPLKAPVVLATRLDGTLLTGSLRRALGAGVGGQTIVIDERFAAGADPRQRTTQLRTAADGSFSLRLPPGPSRDVTAGFDGSRLLTRAAGPAMHLTARTGVRFRASAATAAVGGRAVVFSGRVGRAGASRAVGGLPVQMQFRYPGAGWSEFRTVEADGRGRFRYAYRFSDDDSRGVRFQFRAYVKGREGWPYGPSASRPVSVRGR